VANLTGLAAEAAQCRLGRFFVTADYAEYTDIIGRVVIEVLFWISGPWVNPEIRQKDKNYFFENIHGVGESSGGIVISV
jgi:hypothetical protein